MPPGVCATAALMLSTTSWSLAVKNKALSRKLTPRQSLALAASLMHVSSFIFRLTKKHLESVAVFFSSETAKIAGLDKALYESAQNQVFYDVG